MTNDELEKLINNSTIVEANVGQILIKPGILPGYIYLVIDGRIRYLGTELTEDGPISLATKGGEIVGWSGILRGGPCEYV